MTTTTTQKISLGDLTAEQLKNLKMEVQSTMNDNSDVLVDTILAELTNPEIVLSKASNNPQIVKHLSATSKDGFRTFGTIYIQNKKNPEKLRALCSKA